MYWGCFFATGNKFYVEKMIKQLDNKNTDLSNTLTREAIKWSLMSNATTNKDLITIIKNSKASSEETQSFLTDMVNQLEKTRKYTAAPSPAPNMIINKIQTTHIPPPFTLLALTLLIGLW